MAVGRDHHGVSRAVIRDLRGSVSPEALRKIAVRLAQVRLAEQSPMWKIPSTADTT